jgi:hypothetical protein
MSATDLYTLFYQWINNYDSISDEINYPLQSYEMNEDPDYMSGKDERFTVNY